MTELDGPCLMPLHATRCAVPNHGATNPMLFPNTVCTMRLQASNDRHKGVLFIGLNRVPLCAALLAVPCQVSHQMQLFTQAAAAQECGSHGSSPSALVPQYSSFFCRQMKMAAPSSAAEATMVPLDMCVTLEKNSCGAKLLSISCSRTVYLPAGSFSICSN